MPGLASEAPRLTYDQAFNFLCQTIEKVDHVPRSQITRDSIVSLVAYKRYHDLLRTKIRPEPRMPPGMCWMASMTTDQIVRQLPLVPDKEKA